MAKKTIEQLLKPVIAASIQSLLTAHAENTTTEEYTLKLANDIRHQDKEDNKFTIPAVIQTGDDRPTGTKDVMAWNKSIMIVCRIDVNYVQNFGAVIKTFADETFDRVYEVTDSRDSEPAESDITYQYRFVWSSAKPQGEPRSVSVKAATANSEYTKESIQVVDFVIVGSILYSSNLPMEDQAFYLNIQTGTAPDETTNTWNNSTIEIYEGTDPSLQVDKSVNSIADVAALLVTFPATGYAPYTCMRIFLVDTSTYVYKLAVASGTKPVLSYVPLLGRIKSNKNIQPVFNVSKLAEETEKEYDLDSVGKVKTLTIQRILDDLLHNYLVLMYYTVDTATKFDCQVRMTVSSLSIDKKYNAKITGINYDDDVSEIISFSIIILDEIVS